MSQERPNTLRLSAKAIRTMLGADPEFLVELQRCVVREVVRHLMPKDLDELVITMIKSEVAKARTEIVQAGIEEQALQTYAANRVREVISATRTHSRNVMITDDDQKHLKQAINAAAMNMVSDVMDARLAGIEAEVTRRADEALTLAKTFVDGIVHDQFSVGLDAIVEAKVAARLASIKAAL